MKFLKSVVAAGAASMLMLAPLTSHATLTISFDDLADGIGTNVYYVTDGGIGDLSGVAGLVSGEVTTFAPAWLSVSGKASTASLNGASAGPHLDGFAVNGIGTVRIAVTETDLSLGAAGSQLLNATIGGFLTTGGSVSWALYADDANQAFATSQLVTSGSAFGSGSALVSPLTDPYSMTLVVDLTHTQIGSSSFNYGTTVPEPAGLALVSLALLGAGAATRRRKG